MGYTGDTASAAMRGPRRFVNYAEHVGSLTLSENQASDEGGKMPRGNTGCLDCSAIPCCANALLHVIHWLYKVYWIRGWRFAQRPIPHIANSYHCFT